MGAFFSYAMICRKCKEPLMLYSSNIKSNERNCCHRFRNNKCIDCGENHDTELKCKHCWVHFLHYSTFTNLCRKNEYKKD